MNKLKRQMMVIGLDAKEVARRIGVSHQAVYGWLNGKIRPSPIHLMALAAVLRMTPYDVIRETYEKMK